MASKIILNRTSAWMNRARKFKVFIDGKEVGLVKNDSGEEYIVAPGTHIIRCKIDWCSSPDLTVEVPDNGTEYIRVGSGLKYYVPFYILLLIGLLLPLVFQLSHEPIPRWINIGRIIILIPGILYIIYFLTINKKNYLKIEKDTSNPFSS